MGHTNPPATPPTINLPPSARRRPVNAEAVALLRMAQAGDRDAFGQLYASHIQDVRRYVAARMRQRDRDAVPDLVQDTFTAALEELDRAHDDVRGWLIGLAAKMCTRHGWGQRRYLRAALSIGEHQRSQAATVAVAAPNAATRRLIAQALAGLDPQERLTLQLRFLDGHARETTARIMRCSLWTLKRTQQRALRELAARLGTETTNPRASTTMTR
jgi:RNA polymerase sigma factor (sigma-70 family)